MSLRFNPPPEEAKKLPRYASYAAGEMKTHGSIGAAKNSLNNRMWRWKSTEGETPDRGRKRVTTYAAILENINGTWYTLYQIPDGTTSDTLPWMKEYVQGKYGSVNLYTDYHKDSPYYQKGIENGTFKVFKKATPMTRDEYVAFRLAVQREEFEREGKVLAA
jgi:hypothetical protein